jgi:excinuclease ABC subunit C
LLVSASSYRLLPTYSGVYLYLDHEGNVIYVGKAKNLKKRVASYFSTKDLGEKTRILVSQIHKIKTLGVTSEIESFLLEERLIKKYKPKYNIRLTDGKQYPSIEITVKDIYPKVLFIRKQAKGDGSLYFGPYTSTTSLRTVLKILRRIFPYQNVVNHSNKLCLYYHLGLCPCPAVTKDPNYKKTIAHIIDFLSGNTKKVITDLENERDTFSKNENFEEASNLQRKIDSIKLITSHVYLPFEYELNPNLRADVIENELDELKMILNQNSVGVSDLKRIECYDISNTSGLNATGSMVVFTNGEKDSSSYRRFKIKKFYNNKPNDFAMMQEVLERRLMHKEWIAPSLIVVDGGKGQISSVKEILEKMNLNIPIIGLAKREETIINSALKEIRLPKSSKSLQLVMRLRDEAHRFAITYHRKLRSKITFS